MATVVRHCGMCGIVGGSGLLREQVLAPGRPTPRRASGRSPSAVAKVEGQDVERSVQIVGTLMAQEEVTLGTEVPSTVAKILVDMGDRVQAGQVVIKLDEREARLEVERLSASLQAARESLGRSQQLLESSQANVERAQGRPGRRADQPQAVRGSLRRRRHLGQSAGFRPDAVRRGRGVAARPARRSTRAIGPPSRTPRRAWCKPRRLWTSPGSGCRIRMSCPPSPASCASAW